MKRPPDCCHTPTFTICWDREGTEIVLEACSCWPNGEEVDGLVVWTDPERDEGIIRACRWVMAWAEGRGGQCFGVTDADLDRTERNANRAGVLVIRVSTKWR